MECTALHTRIMKVTLEVDAAREYWRRRALKGPPSASEAFDGFWFGTKSLSRVKELLTALRARYEGSGDSMAVLGHWQRMTPDTRTLVCHWHTQLSDPLYRRFTGDWLPELRNHGRDAVTHPRAVEWVGQQAPGRWSLATQRQLASKLLTAAREARLLDGRQDPRTLLVPTVEPDALTYLLYLLRSIDHEGELFDNAYLRSVGLEGFLLTDRLRQLPALELHQQLDIVDAHWAFDGLGEWAHHSVAPDLPRDTTR